MSRNKRDNNADMAKLDEFMEALKRIEERTYEIQEQNEQIHKQAEEIDRKLMFTSYQVDLLQHNVKKLERTLEGIISWQ